MRSEKGREGCHERLFVLFVAMPKISEEKRRERRDQILDAAWRCFQRNGLHATTMNVIIRASGLSAGAVYSYFPSKEDLIVAAITTSLSGVAALVEKVLGKQPPPQDLVYEIAAGIAAFTSWDGYDLKRIALLGWSEAQRNERVREAIQVFYLDFRGRVARAAERWREARGIKDAGRSEDVAKVVLALLLGFVAEAAILGDVEPSDIKSGLLSLSAGMQV